METKIPHHVPGEPIDADTLMNIVYDHLASWAADRGPWYGQGCGDDSRDGYKLAHAQFQMALDEAARLARKNGYVDGLKFASETIERQREHMPESEAIDDATVTYLARIADEIARHEPGHDKPANSF